MVEKWLSEVESMMISSLKTIVMKSLQGYADTHRKLWVLDWPGQVILCVSQNYWTSEVEEAITNGTLAVSLMSLFHNKSFTHAV